MDGDLLGMNMDYRTRMVAEKADLYELIVVGS